MTSTKAQGDTVALLRNGAFCRLWLTSGSSFAALSAYLLFEQWYVVRELQHPSALGIVMAATVISRLMLMSVGGVMVDRLGGSRVATWSAMSRFFVVLAMIACLNANVLTLGALLVFGVLYGACDAFFTPSINSLAPRLVPDEQLRSANAALQTASQGGMILGPLVGAALLTVSFAAVLLAVAGLLALAVLSVLWLRDPRQTHEEQASGFWSELTSGWRQLKHVEGAWENLGIIVAVNFLFFGPLLMGVPILIAEDASARPSQLGILQGAYAAGMIGGAAAAALVGERPWLIRALLPALGLGLVGVGMATHPWQIALMAAMGVASSVINVLIITCIQRAASPEITGRVMAVVSITSTGTVPVSYAVLGALLGSGLSIAPLIVTAGGLVFVIGAVFLVAGTLSRTRGAADA